MDKEEYHKNIGKNKIYNIGSKRILEKNIGEYRKLHILGYF